WGRAAGWLMTESVALSVVHDRVPGRLRLRAAALKRDPALGRSLEQALRARPGVYEVRANPIIGSVLVRFDLQRVTTDQFVGWTAQLLGDPVPPVDRSSDPSPRAARAQRTDAAANSPEGVGGRGSGVGPNGSADPRPPTPDIRAAKAAADRPALAAAQHWAAHSVPEAYDELDSSPAGLTPAVAARRRARDGPNRLPEVDRRSSAQILKDQIVSVPTLML